MGGDSFETSPDGILITDHNGVVIAANTAYLDMASIQDAQQQQDAARPLAGSLHRGPDVLLATSNLTDPCSCSAQSCAPSWDAARY
ncbi:MAG: hypothetical protein CM15mP103_03480 [Gammaproteobacteria bacterium]|nr:MAG: hypothetical protein CM15mP103_03480 [Gammaproteobacteria bacterium]